MGSQLYVFDDVKDCILPSYKKANQFILKGCEDYDISPQNQIMEIR